MKTHTLKIKKVHALQWVLEPLENHPNYTQKRMFGCLAAYLGSKLVLVIAEGDEPWNGILIPTHREHHVAIQKEFPVLTPHPVLGKWLYLSQSAPEFEATQTLFIRFISRGDSRFGVEPKPKKSKKHLLTSPQERKEKPKKR